MNESRKQQDMAVTFGRVAVVYGGNSAEREISLQTGAAILAALQRHGIDATGIDTVEDYLPRLENNEFDRVFIALHGRGGEDGTIQGMLEMMGIPYTGSGVLGSALAMDKMRCKWIWQAHDIPTPPFLLPASTREVEAAADTLGLPLMVKPVHEGSSCGVSRVVNRENLQEAWLEARKLDADVMAEKWIAGGEYTVSILDGQTLPAIRVETDRDFYDYQAKYHDDSTRYICPCGLDPQSESQIASLALRAFAVVAGSGWGRVDLIIDSQGSPWFIEVNTVPGMTSHSLVPMAAKQAGIGFDELVLRILRTSMEKIPATGDSG